MQRMSQTYGCFNALTNVRSGRHKQLVPCAVFVGCNRCETATACLFFQVDREGGSGFHKAVLSVYVRNTMCGGKSTTVTVRPSLPACATSSPEACIQVDRFYSGWLTVDITAVFSVWQRVTTAEPFGVTLDSENPSLIFMAFSSAWRPRLVVEYAESSSGILVEEKTWHVNFTGKDDSVMLGVERLKQGTFFISNTGAETISVKVETGADADGWAADTGRQVDAGETEALVAKYYGRFYKLVLSAKTKGQAVIRFLGQYYP